MCVCKEIYYKELVPVIMEASESPNLRGELARWRPRRTNGLVPPERPACSSPRESLYFSLKSEGRKKLMSQFEGSGAGRILSYLGESSLLDLFRPSTDWIRPSLIAESNLLYSVYAFKHQISSKNPLTETPRIMFDEMSSYPVAQLSWHIKLTTTGCGHTIPNPTTK